MYLTKYERILFANPKSEFDSNRIFFLLLNERIKGTLTNPPLDTIALTL